MSEACIIIRFSVAIAVNTHTKQKKTANIQTSVVTISYLLHSMLGSPNSQLTDMINFCMASYNIICSYVIFSSAQLLLLLFAFIKFGMFCKVPAMLFNWIRKRVEPNKMRIIPVAIFATFLLCFNLIKRSTYLNAASYKESNNF